jgi:dienelactone hydrolase
MIPTTQIVLLALALLITAADAHAEIVTEEITYQHDNVTLRGYLAYDDELEGPTPGVLVIHEWWGHNEYARERARMLAELGYVAFSLDMYGRDVLATTPERAQRLAAPFYQDRQKMRSRAQAGLDVLADHARVDETRLAAIGYCMGGTVALELARSGADLDAVVSFHGGLSTPDPNDANNIKGTVLVCNGAADPLVPTDERNAFIKEMEDAGVDYLFTEYGGALHSFTNPEADNVDIPGVGYDKKADERSWRDMRNLFEETLSG